MDEQIKGQCYVCGEPLEWEEGASNCFLNDYMGEEGEMPELRDIVPALHLDEDDDSIVRSLTCGHCGCSIEAWEPTPNEMKSGEYPYWDGYGEGEVQEKVQ